MTVCNAEKYYVWLQFVGQLLSASATCEIIAAQAEGVEAWGHLGCGRQRAAQLSVVCEINAAQGRQVAPRLWPGAFELVGVKVDDPDALGQLHCRRQRSLQGIS
jgi:hypothetical protein